MKQAGASKQAKVIFTFIVIIAVISTAVNLYFFMSEGAKKTQQLHELTRFTTERLSKRLAVPLWDMEYSHMKDIIQFEMNEKQIFSILIMDLEEKNMMVGVKRNAGWEAVGSGLNDNWELADGIGLIESDFIEMKKMIEKDGEKLGIVHVYFSRRFLDQESSQMMLRSILSFVFLAVMVILSRLLISKKM